MPGVVGTHTRDAQVTVFQLLAGRQLVDPPHTLAPQPVPGATRHHHAHVLAQQPQRRQVHVVTVQVGEQDEVTPVESSRELHKGIKGSKLVIVEGTGHMLPIEKPEEYNKIVAEFVEGLNP